MFEGRSCRLLEHFIQGCIFDMRTFIKSKVIYEAELDQPLTELLFLILYLW